MKQINGALSPSGFTTVAPNHVRKAVRVVVVVVQMALRVGRGEQRWVMVGGFHGGRLALEYELGVNVGHEMPGGKEHGDVAARVHDDAVFASGEPPAFEQRQHLAARHVDVDDAAAVGDSRVVQCPFDLLLAQFSECPCRCFGPLLSELALGFLEGVPK